MTGKTKLIEALGVTYAAVGQEISDAAMEVIARDLAPYDAQGVFLALSRCRKELRRIALADILQRIPGGHPGVEEAWSLVARGLSDEGPTLVWTEQIREAFGVALGLSDDPIAARMAFKECYARLAAEAMERGTRPAWSASLGWDASGREATLLLAVEKGRLPVQYVAGLLPHRDEQASERLKEIASSLATQKRIAA